MRKPKKISDEIDDEKPKKRGRPTKDDLDGTLIENMARYLSQQQIADILGIEADTLRKHYSADYKRGKSQLAEDIVKAQIFVGVKKKNPFMLTWLGKQYAGQAEKIEQKTEMTNAPKQTFKIAWADERSDSTDETKNATPDSLPPIDKKI